MGTTRSQGAFTTQHASLLGFGLLVAWNTLTSALTVDLDVAALSSPVGRMFFSSLISVASYLAVAAYVHRTGRTPWSRPVVVACCVSGVLFVPLEYAAIGASALAFDVAAMVLYSVAYAGLFLMWNVKIASHQPRIAWVAYAGSMLVAACVYFLVEALGGAAIVAALVLLPLLTGYLLVRCPLPPTDDPVAPDAPDALDAPAEANETTSWKIPWRPIVLIAVIQVAFEVVQHYEGRMDVPDELGRLVAALAILLCAVRLFSRFDENIIARVSTVLVVAALLICGIEDYSDSYGIAKFLVSLGHHGFTLYVYLALGTICFRYGARIEWLFGIIQATYVLFTVPAALVGNMLQTASPLTVDLVVDALALAVMALSMFLITTSTFSSTWGIKASRQVTTEEGVQVTLPQTADYLRDSAYCCTMIAKEFGLTRREEEVLSLMAEGKTFAQIEALLYIAHGTLRAHVQHLYAKLDVHSREEACAFVEEWKRR